MNYSSRKTPFARTHADVRWLGKWQGHFSEPTISCDATTNIYREENVEVLACLASYSMQQYHRVIRNNHVGVLAERVWFSFFFHKRLDRYFNFARNPGGIIPLDSIFSLLHNRLYLNLVLLIGLSYCIAKSFNNLQNVLNEMNIIFTNKHGQLTHTLSLNRFYWTVTKMKFYSKHMDLNQSKFWKYWLVLPSPWKLRKKLYIQAAVNTPNIAI